MSSSYQLRKFLPSRIFFLAASQVVTDETAGPLDKNTFEVEDTTVVHETDEKHGKFDTSPSPERDGLAAKATNDVGAPSTEVTKKQQPFSDIFTIVCAGFALISDSYQGNFMKKTNVVLRSEYKKQYTSRWSTYVSQALLVGEIFGQIAIGLTYKYIGRNFAILLTTVAIVVCGILATASNGSTIYGMLWMLTVSRSIVGFGTGREYPDSSTSASEVAHDPTLK